MSPNEVKVDVSGVPKTFPVNQIEYIQFDDEPKELTDARIMMRAGKLAEALALVQRVKVADVSRDDDQTRRRVLQSHSAGPPGAGRQRFAQRCGRTTAATSRKPAKIATTTWKPSAALGDLLVATGKFEKAETYYARLAATPWPEYRMRAAVLMGRALEAQQQYDKAIEKYDEALAISADGKEAESQHFAAELGKASALAASGKIDDAVKLIDDVIAKADADNQELYARAYVALGNCYKAAGKPKEALLAFLEVDLLYPGSPEQHAEALANLATLVGKSRQGRSRCPGPRTTRTPLPSQPLAHQTSVAAEWLKRSIGLDGATALSPRMKFAVDRLQPRRIDVRVDLGRGNARVAEHLLHLTQVGSARQKVRGKAVA